MSSEDSVPRALREVWEWKDTMGEQLKGLAVTDALKVIHKKADAIIEHYGIRRVSVREAELRVAEGRAGYAPKGDRLRRPSR